MDLRKITPEFAVAPQLLPEDIAAVAALGYRVLIDNRPDEETDPGQDSAAMAALAAAAGLGFHYLPYYPGLMTPDLVADFEALMAGLEGPVLAYCRSGTRSSHLWAMSQAGRMPIEEIVGAAARAGYDHTGLMPLLAAHGAARVKNG
ncbi:TIGR01244 family protein [Rhodobacter xanthinilyticus]|uniref:TIGR01244 family protein n=1 Tax=Rhodobacter xanthinilyticus TaxID=1850250 RepID=A0A1D9MCB8_9RHOB|nr:TIGR01244 family sulfur transferase [Rhodobacter xanthinilyticus]AOZ69481.1 TIGR01244 family protein [Rhodobacter xanthinilyticus]